jgi:hypothetical protein
MYQMKMNIVAATLIALATLAFGQARADAINLVTNGNFETSSYAHNNQFGTGYGGQGISGWTGGNGYQLYFVGDTGATNSADSQYDSGYNTGAEKFYTMPNSISGGNYVGLDGDQTNGIQGSISQTVTGLTAGAYYSLSFSWATGQLQSRTGATTNSIQVSFGNQTFTTPVISTPSQGSTPWLTQTVLFKATGTSQVLSFLSAGTPAGLPPMVALDGVSLVAAPEPASLAVMSTGLVLLGFFYRRRQQRVA